MVFQRDGGRDLLARFLQHRQLQQQRQQQQQQQLQQQLFGAEYDLTAAFLQKFPLHVLNNGGMATDGWDRNAAALGRPRAPSNQYSRRAFYEDLDAMNESFLNYYRPRWLDFSQLRQPSPSDLVVPWTNKKVEPLIELQVEPQVELIQNSISSFDNINNNSNKDFLGDFTSNLVFKGQSPKKLDSVSLQTSISSDSNSVSTSPLNFEKSVTPVKEISTNGKDIKKTSEENNNKIHSIEVNNSRNGSISSSDSSRSDSTDEKAASYAEIIKHPKIPFMKQSSKIENCKIINFKKGEPIKSNKGIPPSKKASITLPDGPFLPNHQLCRFCRNNGEEESVYRTHVVRDSSGVKCPYLFSYVCPHCKATVLEAHTISRCPNSKNKSNKLNK